MLVACSPVFERMFYGGSFRESLKESSDFDNAAIKVTDISSHAFNLMLDFIYMGELVLTEKNDKESSEDCIM